MADEKADVTADEAPKAKAPRAAAKKPAAAKAEATATSEGTAAKAAAPKAKATKAPAKAKAEPVAKPVEQGHGGTLRVHHLRPAPGAHTPKTRVGRGEASKGKTAGRGTKGTGARKNVPENFEGGQMPLHMRLPKLRGFSNPFRVEYQVVNVAKLAELFPNGGEVTVADLVAKGAVRDGQLVKVLGNGELTVALQVSAHAFSGSAKSKIEAAGGSVTEL